MESRSIAIADKTKRLTNWLCPNCFKRIVRTESNPIIPAESKTPTPVIVGNPHNRRSPKVKVSTIDIPITQDAVDQKLETE